MIFKKIVGFDKKWEPLASYVLRIIVPVILFALSITFAAQHGWSQKTLIYCGSVVLIWVALDPIYRKSFYEKGHPWQCFMCVITMLAIVITAYASMWMN
jgi:heme/copper-type cytochrome/quinol oxidase subunit 4